ncbi:MAG TPA: chloride channel protein [Candidatus Binatia bacterium]|nr:chloride channel protein [Candidatus Binatia bacterium]
MRGAGSTDSGAIPTTLFHPAALRFWLAVLLIGVSTGLGAAALTKLLEVVQQVAWRGSGTNIVDAARQAGAVRHIVVLISAGLLTGAGQFLLKHLSSGNSIDTTAAIWFYAGRMPVLRTLGSAVLSIFAVGMGASLGREGAPKQAGAVFANLFADVEDLSVEQRRLLVACGAGAGMSAAYGVPLGGALFALEVMRGKLALRYVLPALFTSMIATAVSWISLPNAPTYRIPSFPLSASEIVWVLLVAPIAALASVMYVRLVRWADQGKPRGWQRFIAPAVVLGILGLVSIRFPEVLGNGKDVSQLLFTGQVVPRLFLALFLLKPLATIMCLRSGVPGGLFTPSLTFGALLGAVLGHAWSWLWPGVPAGLFALLGAGAVLAATTQGPVSAVVLILELTGRDRSFILPLMLIAGISTLIARSIEQRSIYDAKLTDEEIAERQRLREQSTV